MSVKLRSRIFRQGLSMFYTCQQSINSTTYTNQIIQKLVLSIDGVKKTYKISLVNKLEFSLVD